jgi:alginate O-acetyltransferase complex protein AlgJ
MIQQSTARGFAFGRRAALSGCLAAGGILRSAPGRAETAGLTVIGKDGWLFPLWEVSSRVDPQALRAVSQLLGEAVGLFKAAGIEVVIALVPAKSRVYRQYLPDDARLAPDIDKRYATAMTELRRTGALVPDLDAAFGSARTSQPGRLLYFKTDTHWTSIGAEAAATELATRMKDGLRLPPAGKPGTRFGGLLTTSNSTGNLVRWLSPEDKPKYPAESYQIHETVLAGGGAALVEEDEADTVVVGNSYVQPKYGFQPLLSNQLNRPVGLAWKGNNFGPYFTLAEYVKGESFKRQRPKVLVWSHLESDIQNLSNSSSWGQNAIAPQSFVAELRRALGR